MVYFGSALVRTVARTCAVGLAALGAFVLWVQPTLQDSIDQMVIRETRQKLDTLAEGLRPLLVQKELTSISATLDGWRLHQPSWRRIELVDATGRPLYPLHPAPPLAALEIEKLTQDIRLPELALAKLSVYVDLAEDRAEAQRLARGFFFAIVAAMAVALLLIAGVQQWMLGRFGRRHVPDGPHTVRGDTGAPSDARRAAESAHRAKADFLSMMRHEILTPMNGVLGMAQMLLMPNLKEADQKNYARTILTSGQTLLALLNDALDFSRNGTHDFQLKITVFEPEQLMRETQTLFSRSASDKSLHLTYTWAGPKGVRYQADARRVRQMLFKLVGNGIKFTEQGWVHMEGCEIAREGDSALLEFSVRDTGRGVPAGQLECLFQPFSQADNAPTTREFGGTGLGLSIVRNLAQRMGGGVGVGHEPGGGSRFWFRIRTPIVPAGENSRNEARSMAVPTPASPGLAQFHGHILVVEDHAINRQVIGAMLAKLGLKVSMVHDGQAAVDAIARGETPSAILMDIHMPVLDGYGATQRIRQWERERGRPSLPIIALTADALEKDREACITAGMDDFLHKPVALDALVSALGRWLGAGAAPAPDGPALQVNGPRFIALVDELIPLLVQNKYDAVTRFSDLQMLVEGTDIAMEIEEVGRALRAFRFDWTLEQLRSMAATQREKSLT